MLPFPVATRPGSRMIEVPILGRVAAGQPILAQERVEDTVQVDSFLLGTNKKVYGLRVQGDSMIGDGILPGDYVFVKKQLNAEDGEIVVAMIDDEATVKRMYSGGQAGSLPALQPAHGPHLRGRGGLPLHHDPRRGGRRVPQDAVGPPQAGITRTVDRGASARAEAGARGASSAGVLPPYVEQRSDEAARRRPGSRAECQRVLAWRTYRSRSSLSMTERISTASCLDSRRR